MTPTNSFDDPDLPEINAVRWGCITSDGTAFEVPGAYLTANTVRGLLAFLDEAMYTVCALWVRDAEDAARARGLGQAMGDIETVIIMPTLPSALAVNDAPRW